MEGILYVWGAEIRRCVVCNGRRAIFSKREIKLRDDASGEKTLLVGFLAIAGGILFTLALALWILRRSYRLPF